VRTERGFDRFVNFSDAVVAIAITLLVLPLVNTAANIGSESGSDLIATHEFKLFIFVLSFAVIGQFWLVHHRMFESAIGYNDQLLWANFLWLASIVFLPFPTELLASATKHQAAVYGLYVGTMLVTSTALLIEQWIITANPELQAESVRGTLTVAPAVTATVVIAVALVIAVAVPSIGLWSLMLLFVAKLVDRFMHRVRGAAEQPARSAKTQS
jgi:uncharacterized membrane protein